MGTQRTVSMRRFFWAPKTYVKTDGKENIHNFTLKKYVYLNLLIGYTVPFRLLSVYFQGAKKLCPQCNMITSPGDLRRIYLWNNEPATSYHITYVLSSCCDFPRRHSLRIHDDLVIEPNKGPNKIMYMLGVDQEFLRLSIWGRLTKL